MNSWSWAGFCEWDFLCEAERNVVIHFSPDHVLGSPAPRIPSPAEVDLGEELSSSCRVLLILCGSDFALHLRLWRPFI